MIRASMIAVVCAAAAACGYRPCSAPSTRLLGELVSQASSDATRATLHESQWSLESEEPGPTDGRPPFSFRTIDAGEVVDLGHRGRLKLVFYNGRLSATQFIVSDPAAYFDAVKRLPDAVMLPGSIVSLGANTRIWRRGGATDGPIVEWYDDCLRADQDSWIRHYS